jgi:hypothetical protein
MAIEYEETHFGIASPPLSSRQDKFNLPNKRGVFKTDRKKIRGEFGEQLTTEGERLSNKSRRKFGTNEKKRNEISEQRGGGIF